MKSSLDQYRDGAMGAILDEYDRALQEFVTTAHLFGLDQFDQIVDPSTDDPNCQSVKTVVNHVIRAGYGYSNDIREKLAIDEIKRADEITSLRELDSAADEMFGYMIQTAELLEPVTNDTWTDTTMTVSWGQTYDLEQLLEHAIVHLLRHRRQLEKFNLVLQE